MKSDVQRWEAKYLGAELAPALRVDPLLVRYIDTRVDRSRALDVAAGTCHASVYLAQQGFQVTALDCSAAGLALGRRLAKREGVAIELCEVDLDKAVLPKGLWAVICCFRYLNRSLFVQMAKGLAPGGILIFKTFNVHHLVKAPSFSPEYVLQPGELASAFLMLDTIELADGDDPQENTSWIVACRPR